MTAVVVGCDVSPTHCALITLGMDGVFLGAQVLCETKKEAEACRKFDARLHVEPFPAKIKAIEEPDRRNVLRLVFMEDWLTNALLRAITVPAGGYAHEAYVAVEDYAFGAASGAHQIGEVGGLFRVIAVPMTAVRLRLYNQSAIKKYMTGAGNCEKAAVGEAVREEFKTTFHESGLKKASYGDCEDAYAITAMCLTEVRLRCGDVVMRQLPEHRVSVFNACSSANPHSILSREWITLDL